MRLSICIPTYNRARHLADCLTSIAKDYEQSSIDIEVCISDNGSQDDTASVIASFASRLPLIHSRNAENLGIPRNFLKVVSLASGEFAWLLGDDDLLMPGALARVDALIAEHPQVDVFYANANHLHTDYIVQHPRPFDTADLPPKMTPFSPRRVSGELDYFELVDPNISFDFLGGMFLSIFRRTKWVANADALDPVAITDPRTFSHFDNTFPHLKIFARAFACSRAYFEAEPVSVCLTGAREWAPMYPLVHSVRLVEALENYRANGLGLWRYLRCRNAALSNFLPELGFMILNPTVSGRAYINPAVLILKNCMYPNMYLSLFYFIGRRLKTLGQVR